MAIFNRFFVFFLFVTLAVFIQQGGFLNVGGIVPNLFLAISIIGILSGERMGMLIAIFCGVFLSAFFVYPFWMGELGMWGLIILLLTFFRRKFTGSAIADFLLMTLAAELLFYGAFALLNLSTFSLFTLGYEFAYTAILGIPLWLVAKRYIL